MKNITPLIKKTLSFLNGISGQFNTLNKQFSDNRTKKITDREVLLFSLLYTEKNTTQLNVCNNIIINNNKLFDVTSITKKLNNINIEVFSKLYDNIEQYYIDTFNKSTEFLAVDGVYNNTNILHTPKLETNMNLCIYDIVNKNVTDMIYSDVGKKNNEAKILEQHIEANKNNYKNKCLICDRAYFSFSLFDYLHNNDIKFIIRIKKSVTNTTIAKYPFLRVIRRAHNKNLYEEVIIATNISKTEKNDLDILKLYSKRWNIEEYFKHLKHNYKFQYLTLNTKNKLLKHYVAIEIMTKIKQILLELYKHVTKYKEKTIKNKNNDVMKTHINENNTMNLLFSHYIHAIVMGTFDVNVLKSFISTTKININKINIHNNRTSKLPFTKWYIKSYHNIQNNINEKYSVKLKHIKDQTTKTTIKMLIKEESMIKAKRKALIKNAEG